MQPDTTPQPQPTPVPPVVPPATPPSAPLPPAPGPESLPPPPQPAVVPPTPTPGVTPPTGEDPGKTLAIVGIILAFVFSLAGIFVSLAARKKSLAAGFHNTLAIVAIVLNSISLVFGLLFGTLVALGAIAAIQQQAQQEQSQQ